MAPNAETVDENNNYVDVKQRLFAGKSEFRDDFTWVYEDQPHTSRRKAITKKYPCVRELFGKEDHAKHIIAAQVAMQVIACYLLQDASIGVILFFAYTFGGTINHSLVLAIHDISHNTMYGNSNPAANRWFSIFANLPIGIPTAITFKKYHIDHHRYLGGLTTEGHYLDTDTPCPWEGKFFKGPILKTIWLFINPAFYGLRPAFTSPKPITEFEVYNILVIVAFDAFIYYTCGIKAVFYLIFGTVLALGCHPASGHFIAEHYNFLKNLETYSYYGPLNKILHNVGYHIEHHDFPFIASARYPEVSKIAPEFYRDLPYISSYCSIIWSYITDPAVGPWSRLHRVYDMKTGSILGLNSGLLTKWIDQNSAKGLFKKDTERKFYNIVKSHEEFEKVKTDNDYAPGCVTFPKYFEFTE